MKQDSWREHYLKINAPDKDREVVHRCQFTLFTVRGYDVIWQLVTWSQLLKPIEISILFEYFKINVIFCFVFFSELAVEIFSEVHKGKSLNRLQLNTAAQISRNACVSPCSLVLAMLYFDRLKKCNMDYLERTVPSDLFLVSLVNALKFNHNLIYCTT